MNIDLTLILLQRINGWASQRRADLKASWKDVFIQVTWALTGNARLWWEALKRSKQLAILENEDPLEAMLMALSHEFIGTLSTYFDHYEQMFMRQMLCSRDLIDEYYCTMQKLYYKIPDHQNIAYLHHYIASMLEKIIEFVHHALSSQSISIDTLSLASLQKHILQIMSAQLIRPERISRSS